MDISHLRKDVLLLYCRIIRSNGDRVAWIYNDGSNEKFHDGKTKKPERKEIAIKAKKTVVGRRKI